MLWSQIFPSKCLGSAWSCETKQAKKHFPGSRDACYWWLNRCSVAPAAFCTFFGTPCILLVPFSRTPCICLLTKKCEITCIFFVSYWQLENCQMAFITSKTEPSHWVLKVWQHFRQTVFPQKTAKIGYVSLQWHIQFWQHKSKSILTITPLPTQINASKFLAHRYAKFLCSLDVEI